MLAEIKSRFYQDLLFCLVIRIFKRFWFVPLAGVDVSMYVRYIIADYCY